MGFCVILQTKSLLGSIPGQGSCLGRGSGPWLGGCEGNPSMFLSHIDASLLLFLPSPFSKNKINKIFKNKNETKGIDYIIW